MKQKARFSPGLIFIILLALVLLNLSALSWLGWPAIKARASNLPIAPLDDAQKTQPNPVSASATPTPSETPAQPTSSPVSIQVGALNPQESLNAQGVLLVTLRDGNWVHLFAYHPGLLSLTRLTNNNWDEIDPAVSPDGKQLAYASRQNGYWDLYTRDLESGKTVRVTDTPDYEGNPSWSPDGQWLACDSYRNGNLDIYLVSVANPKQEPVRLTEDPAADSQPAWSPQGRKIAFVSTRSGTPQIWLADLDRNDASRLQMISQEPLANDSHPAWSRDGRYLAWAQEKDGDRRLMAWDSTHPDQAPSWAGYGDWPAWTPDGTFLFTIQTGPNQSSLETYEVASGKERSPLQPLFGQAYGLSWKPGPLNGWLADAIKRADVATPAPLVQPVLTVQSGQPSGRTALITIPDISAPQPMLSDAVDEAFQSLRLQAAKDSGWDVLSSLENAFIPMTTPNDPSIQEDWLYTGRAFSLNPLILSAGWMAIVREEINGQTYWRLYLKARFQDGSSGLPLDRPIWDLNARYAGDPQLYEQGGQAGGVPEGYWIDLTELAQRYGWERLTSHINWRTYYSAIRFNQFVYRSGLDWDQAMRQLYPPEALATPTSIPTPTSTPTSTREPTRTPTLFVPTDTPTSTPTRRPTLTTAP